MPSNLSIARMGSKPFLDTTADQHNGKDYAWLIAQLEELAQQRTTKRKICNAMGITGPTLDKYIFIINLEKLQRHGQ